MLQEGQKESVSPCPGPLHAASMFIKASGTKMSGAKEPQQASAVPQALPCSLRLKVGMSNVCVNVALHWAQDDNEAENDMVEEDISNKPARTAALSYESVSASCQASCCLASSCCIGQVMQLHGVASP